MYEMYLFFLLLLKNYSYYNLERLIEFLFVEDGRGVAANIWSQAVQSSAHIKFYVQFKSKKNTAKIIVF
jgi:hypothetical protein